MENKKMLKERDVLIDILKGIGIVSVVIGHSGVLFPGGEFIPSFKFVYMYHLMLFFFTAGAVFAPDKYTDPYAYIGRQLKGSLPLFWIYNFIYLGFHNLFSTRKLLDIPMFTTNDIVIAISGILTCTHIEQLAGALWFVPVLLIGKVLFAVGFGWAEKQRHKVLSHICVVVFFSAIGLYTNYWDMYFTYHSQTAFLGIPVIYLGVLFSRYRMYIQRFATPFTCIMSTLMLLGFIKLDIGYIELSMNQIIDPWLFYPITVLGLIFAISFASTIRRNIYLSRLFSYFGSVSFHIMSLHFLVFKGLDWLCAIVGLINADAKMLFPTSMNNIGIIYSVLGVGFPTLAVMLFRKYVPSMKRCG